MSVARRAGGTGPIIVQSMQRERNIEVQYGERLTRGAHFIRSALTSGPGLLWMQVFLLIPLLAIVFISFLTRGAYGEFHRPLTLENYARLLGFGPFGFDSLYPAIFLRSLALGAFTTVLCVLIGLPLAFFIANLPPRYKTGGLTLVVIPFWTNLLIRTYAWQILLAPQGWLSRLAATLGLVSTDTPLYPGLFAVGVGMLCDFLPFMVLPLYASMEKIDWNIVEAAMDLGADHRQAFRHAVLPQVRPGLVAGSVLVFLPATGQFVIPDLLGGAKTALLGNAIQQQFGPSRDWPFGSAIVVAALALVIAGLWIQARFAAAKGEPLAP
ncbi:MAG: ABC transporter permease [Verrucomicrobia bacterium]|nr:MAG: ABC transporter permease [Verrucomicrobiota bacterium]